MTTLKEKQVLVTGASGFIGSHLVQRLLAQGAQVRAMVHYRSAVDLHNLEFLSETERSSVEVIKGNIEDPFFVRRAVHGMDTVFHLAALIPIPYSYIAPAAYVATNISGTLNVLEAAREEGIRRMVHISTSECYGTAEFTPMDESHPVKGQSPYSASKISADKLAESYYCSFGTPVVTIRPFNTYGPRQSGRAIIPTVISQLAAGATEIRVGSTTPIRDFTYATDTAEGMILGATTDGVEGELINLGYGKGITIGDLIDTIKDLMNSSAPVKSEDQRQRPDKSEVKELISNNGKAREVLGWHPQVDIATGLSQTIEFIQAHPELYRSNRYEV